MTIIDPMFEALIARNGSDLHLSIGYPPMIRVRGELAALRSKELDEKEIKDLMFELLAPQQRKRFEEERDLDFAYQCGDKARFRANYFYKMTGMGAVFRVIPTEIMTLDQLKCPAAVRALAQRPSGLVLVTGPTGSGKSTTLAAMIRQINESRPCHILTVEDPVEFVHEPIQAQVTHREVGQHASSFAEAIRSAGREDANVILIGELRNNETMKLALQLASFGVLVFGTVHTNSAASTVDRILNSFPADEQPIIRGLLAESLVGVVAQQLIKTADGKGRVAAHEILIGSSALASMIREGKTYQLPNLMQAGQSQGMQTMDMALERLVASQTISVQAAIEKALDKESFERIVKNARS